MGKGRSYFEQMIARTDLSPEALPGQSIVEIAGDKRVLIECHRGILAYNRELIQVSVGYGSVCIQGCGLEIIHMTREKLIISGRIDSVQLQRRG